MVNVTPVVLSIIHVHTHTHREILGIMRETAKWAYAFKVEPVTHNGLSRLLARREGEARDMLFLLAHFSALANPAGVRFLDRWSLCHMLPNCRLPLSTIPAGGIEYFLPVIIV